MRRFTWLSSWVCFLLWQGSTSFAEPPAIEPTVSIAFVGDILLDDTPGRVVKRGRDPFAPFAKILSSADIRVGNLECVIATVGKADPGKPFSFRAHPRTVRVLKRHFDAVALANNHSGDFGPAAFVQMLGLLQASGIGYFGGGKTLTEAHRPLLIERNGLRIALLGYNEFFPRRFEADTDTPGIAWSEDEQVILDITNARKMYSADLVIPMMHWGWEHKPLASERQRQLARTMIDAGADAVVGGHPHVTQDIETYRGKPIFIVWATLFLMDSRTRITILAGCCAWIWTVLAYVRGISTWPGLIVKASRIQRQGSLDYAGVVTRGLGSNAKMASVSSNRLFVTGR